ncbi:uncharacterized protein F5891DRAFT_1182116 [Suillus fuscotomentosus]|uniref:Uncharacterized protein n=1 Tax=Suillus fuscotomentosus TaxID=1912939 RepID=A0AAD4EII3_9AGAM|nr:uncharacterized protein F5891DRAFT_1182116 [Suillus fuscotomentosus]KAG1906706.1 hypothetical protein F5891DRAFT_1182116 [Suillus fuscotomentosus]
MRLKDQSGLAQADLVLEATLDEVFKIHDMAADKTQFQDLVSATKLAYDKLVIERDRLEQQKKSINPVKLFSAYRSTRLLVEAGKKLYTNTRTTSERMRRQLLSVASTNVERVECLQIISLSAGSSELNVYPDDDLSSDARISGIAVPLDEPLDEPTASHFTAAVDFITSQVDLLCGGNPFTDDFQVEDYGVSAGTEPSSTADSATSDDGVASPSGSRPSEAFPSESGNNYFIFNNSYVASRSVMNTPTLNYDRSHSQGSSSARR